MKPATTILSNPVSGPNQWKVKSQIEKTGIKTLYYAEAQMREKSVERSHLESGSSLKQWNDLSLTSEGTDSAQAELRIE